MKLVAREQRKYRGKKSQKPTTSAGPGEPASTKEAEKLASNDKAATKVASEEPDSEIDFLKMLQKYQPQSQKQQASESKPVKASPVANAEKSWSAIDLRWRRHCLLVNCDGDVAASAWAELGSVFKLLDLVGRNTEQACEQLVQVHVSDDIEELVHPWCAVTLGVQWLGADGADGA